MSLKYRLLSKKTKKSIREIARKSLAETNNQEQAIDLAIKEIKYQGIFTSFLLGIALDLAIKLIIYWIKNNVFVPSKKFSKEEPGGFDE